VPEQGGEVSVVPAGTARPDPALASAGDIRVLVVEDDDTIGVPLVEGLRMEGFAAQRARTATEALAAVAVDVDFVLLDLGLPDLDGREVCRRMRASSSVPIIVITARSDELDRVLLLETGADDYVVKPFGLRELVARIRAVRRRIQPAASDVVVAQELGPLRIDRSARRVWLGGEEVELTPKEFDLLSYLAEEPGVVRTRADILARVWDENWWGPTKTLDVHVAALRRKLAGFDAITTLRGVGYRLDPPG
jgi:DNA-binding response OmpR family regulator